MPFWVSLWSGAGPGERGVEGAMIGKSVIEHLTSRGMSMEEFLTIELASYTCSYWIQTALAIAHSV